MSFLKYINIVILCCCFSAVYSQDNTAVPERTPEQEAARQTEKLQQELQLTSEQTRKVYEVNLKYARARKESNTRSESVKRIKDKESELMNILDARQRTNLQNKRYERSSFQPSTNSNQSVGDSKVENNSRSTSSAESRQSKASIKTPTKSSSKPQRR